MPVSVSVQCVDLAANPYGPQGTSLGFEMHFSRNVQRDDDYGTPVFEITGQDDTDFTWDAMGGPAGSLGNMYRIWRWSATPKVPTPEAGVVSDVNGLVITVPRGRVARRGRKHQYGVRQFAAPRTQLEGIGRGCECHRGHRRNNRL